MLTLRLSQQVAGCKPLNCIQFDLYRISVFVFPPQTVSLIYERPAVSQ